MTTPEWRPGEWGQAAMRQKEAYLLHDSLDGCLFILIIITIWEVEVLEGHLNEGEMEMGGGVRLRYFI